MITAHRHIACQIMGKSRAELGKAGLVKHTTIPF
jgi:hypothetical protein